MGKRLAIVEQPTAAMASILLPILAQQLFPRGAGFYFDLVKLGFLVVGFFIWIRLCQWVDQDVDQHDLRPEIWNTLFLAAGALGLLLIWISPIFWLAYLAMIGLCCSAGLIYIGVRNQRVPVQERLLTRAHLKEMGERLQRFEFRKRAITPATDNKPPAPSKPVRMMEGDYTMDIRFIGRSFGERDFDPKRVQRASESKGYKLALELVYEAVSQRATDIHLEPAQDEMSVRYRIDGVLQAVDPFSRQMGDAVINIFKVLSNMDITEKRKPQDGSFQAEIDGRHVDFRVATAGSIQGEKLVMRILDRSQRLITLEELGMREKMRNRVREYVTRSQGMFLVCGPTGSGKSTTLYSCLGEIDRMQVNIITIENPVEYQLDNVTQIEVNLKTGKTFANELRSILRQDPDVIMIGEIRDKETAEIACQAAQTGHMVFSTLHSNDTVGAIARLLDLGVPPFMVASSLTAVLAQRLVRVLCPKCKVRYRPNPEILQKANLSPEKIRHFYRAATDEDTDGTTCSHCGGTGHYGRTGVFELLVLTDPIRDLIRQNPNLTAIKQEAIKSGMRHLYEDGMRQVIEGNTSIQELMRVCK